MKTIKIELTLTNGNVFTINDGQQDKLTVSIKEQIVKMRFFYEDEESL